MLASQEMAQPFTPSKDNGPSLHILLAHSGKAIPYNYLCTLNDWLFRCSLSVVETSTVLTRDVLRRAGRGGGGVVFGQGVGQGE